MKQAQFSSIFLAAIGAFFLYLAVEKGTLDGNSIVMGVLGLTLILIGSIRYRWLKQLLEDIQTDNPNKDE